MADLHRSGLNRILEKVGEEATEVILAAKDASAGNTTELVKDTADLWFQSLVMLSHLGEDHSAVLAELQQRFNISGLAEKAARTEKSSKE